MVLCAYIHSTVRNVKSSALNHTSISWTITAPHINPYANFPNMLSSQPSLQVFYLNLVFHEFHLKRGPYPLQLSAYWSCLLFIHVSTRFFLLLNAIHQKIHLFLTAPLWKCLYFIFLCLFSKIRAPHSAPFFCSSPAWQC